MKIYWSKGVVVCEGSREELLFFKTKIPKAVLKEKRAFLEPLLWIDVREKFLVECPFPVEEDIFRLLPQPQCVSDGVELRDYQREAIESWESSGKRGVIVLPTGAGKTYLAVGVMVKLKIPTLVVVPTLVLVSQWKEILKRYFADVGEWSGRTKELRPITVATYDSASLGIEILGNKFAFLVFDEVHHLPSQTYRLVAELSVAPYRLGLSATPERQDEMHVILDRICGPVVFRAKPEDFRGKWLADWQAVRIKVQLSEDERRAYRENMDRWINFLLSRGLEPGKRESFLKVVKMAGWDREARQALISLQTAKRIAFGTKRKIEVLRKILQKHKDEKILIFTQFQDFARRISEEFFVPVILSNTPQHERREYISGFQSGKYRVLVSAHVLDEGFDVPDASVGVIVSGTSSSREFIQRLGRILRPTKEKAILYELVSYYTTETMTSARRRGEIF